MLISACRSWCFWPRVPGCFCNLSVKVAHPFSWSIMQFFFFSCDLVLMLVRLIRDAVNCSKRAPPAPSAFTCVHYVVLERLLLFGQRCLIWMSSLFSFRMTHRRRPEMCVCLLSFVPSLNMSDQRAVWKFCC